MASAIAATAITPAITAMTVVLKIGAGAAARGSDWPDSWLLGPLFPPAVERTARMGLEAAAYPVVSQVSVTVFACPDGIVSFKGPATFTEPQLIQSEKFPAAAPVLFSLTVKVTI